MNLILLILCILVLLALICYHIKYKKPFVNYDDSLYQKMSKLRFYFYLVIAIIVLIIIQFQNK